jgi:putative oxidoreductase
MSTNDELYSTEQTQHFRAGQPEPAGGSTDLLDDFEEGLDDQLPATRWHVGLDLGLLVLRIAVGGTMLLSGLYKFGLFNDFLNMDVMPESLAAQGFSQPGILSWVLVLTEVIGGGLLIVGLLTPVAAASALGVTACAVYLAKDGGYFGQVVEGGAVLGGYQLPLLTAAGATALLFTGPGRIAFDLAFPWRKRPLPYGIVGFLLAAGGAVVVLTLFR